MGPLQTVTSNGDVGPDRTVIPGPDQAVTAIIYDAANRVLWTTRMAGTCGQFYTYLVMQTDGNLVEYTVVDFVHDKAVWNSNSVFH